MLNVRRKVALLVLSTDTIFLCLVLFVVPKVPYALVGCAFCVASPILILCLTKTREQLLPWFLGGGILCALGAVVSSGYLDSDYRPFYIAGMLVIIPVHSWLTTYIAGVPRDEVTDDK